MTIEVFVQHVLNWRWHLLGIDFVHRGWNLREFQLIAWVRNMITVYNVLLVAKNRKTSRGARLKAYLVIDGLLLKSISLGHILTKGELRFCIRWCKLGCFLLRCRCYNLLRRCQAINWLYLKWWPLNHHFAMLIVWFWRKKTLLVIQTMAVMISWAGLYCFGKGTSYVEIVKYSFRVWRLPSNYFLGSVILPSPWSDSSHMMLVAGSMMIIQLMVVCLYR